MRWKVDQARGSWTATVVMVADRDYEYLRDTKIAVVLTDCADLKSRRFDSGTDWWKRGSFSQLIEEDAIILIRKHAGYTDTGSSVAGEKLGLFRIRNITYDGDQLRFNIIDRLKGAVE